MTPIEAHTTAILGIPCAKPDVEYFRVLGCIYYIYLQEEQRLGKSFKYYLRAQVRVLVSYVGESIYRIYILSTNRTVEALAVQFDKEANYNYFRTPEQIIAY